MHDYAAAQDFLLALAACGENLQDRAVFGRYLAPLVCRNPREQANFPANFDRWCAKSSSPASQPQPQPLQSAAREIELADRGWRKWRWILGCAAVIVVVAAAWFLRGLVNFGAGGAVQIVPQVPAVNPGVPVGIVAYIGVAIALPLLSWAIWWYSADAYSSRGAQPPRSLTSFLLPLRAEPKDIPIGRFSRMPPVNSVAAIR